MIISQTPYRVSFAGGGTDLPAFYRREYGAVLSTTIDQHMYVTIHRRFEPTIRVSYSRTETSSTLDGVQHELVREAMRQAEIDEPLEITTIGDVPAGTGMGSSSSLTVGLLNALYAYQYRVVSPRLLAEQACRIEIDVLKKPIGRQDQYAAAFGGINYIRFNSDDTVDIEPRPLSGRDSDRTGAAHACCCTPARHVTPTRSWSGNQAERPTAWKYSARCATCPRKCG